jgi:prepilin-type N-terminal cleavage/methylation domain-containing protein
MPPAGATGRRAFTLIEVVLAVSLFAVAVVVLAAAYVNILNSIESVRVDQTLEQELAFVRSQVLLETELENIEKGGEVPTPSYGAAVWSATVTPTMVADLFRVDLVIELPGDGAASPPRSIVQTLHVLRPSWSVPTERDALRAESSERLGELKRTRPL